MRIALDSSALAKRYVVEPGTPAVLAHCREAEEIILSVLCLPEILSALNRLRREERFDAETYEGLKKDLVADIAEATVIELSREVLARAILCLETMALRTLDAIHVASAAAASSDVLISADYRQCRAAVAAGLTVVDLSALAQRS